MQREFQEFLNTYDLESNNRKQDKDSRYHELIEKIIPQTIRSLIGEDYIVRGSYGQGRKTPYPWIGIFHQHMTTSAQKGLYVVYLFRSDMQGFYLSFHQGFTYFKENFKKPYQVVTKTSKYFQEQITSPYFSDSSIDLNSKHVANDRGYGYEHTNILAKYYESNQFSEEELRNDLYAIIELYESFINDMSMNDYEVLVKNIAEDNSVMLPLDDADHEIHEALRKETGQDEVQLTTLKEPTDIPSKKAKGQTIKTHHTYKKTDYEKKAKEDSKTGLSGETLVFNYEVNRLTNKGIKDPRTKIHWVSQESDAAGYDLKSINIDEQTGKEYPIYIEVKTTKLNATSPFYISDNELRTMEEKGKQYYIYRVYAIDDDPNFYIISHDDFVKKFNTTPYSYIVDLDN